MSEVLSVRVPDELKVWANEEAEKRGIPVGKLLEQGLLSFREDCEQGIPELRAMAARQSSFTEHVGVGDCPERPEGLGHVFKEPSEDSLRRCRHCDLQGRGGRDDVSYLTMATAERAELFSRLRCPDSVKGGKVRDRAAG